jgi:hypothetical protein
MDDYSINSLTESKNEWCARLVSILTSTIIQGIKSIFNEALLLCSDNKEDNKYLMTFQNLLSQIPSWNPSTIEQERIRIEKVSGCKYLEDLITCVHIIQLKALTCIRVGLKQKKIDIDIPSVDKFIHQIYINTARKLYSNIYLFEKDIYPLQIQKNNRELEIIIKESILNAIRDNIPIEKLLHAYMDETEEEIIEKENKSKETTDVSNNVSPNTDNISNNKSNDTTNSESTDLTTKTELSTDDKLDILADKITEKSAEKSTENTTINFSNNDNVFDENGKESVVNAPKDLETLEKIAAENSKKYNDDNDDNDGEENIKLNIGDNIDLGIDTINLSNPIELENDPIIDDIEIL